MTMKREKKKRTKKILDLLDLPSFLVPRSLYVEKLILVQNGLKFNAICSKKNLLGLCMTNPEQPKHHGCGVVV